MVAFNETKDLVHSRGCRFDSCSEHFNYQRVIKIPLTGAKKFIPNFIPKKAKTPIYRHFFNLRYLPKIKDLVQAIGCRFDSCLEHILNQQATNASLTGVKINNKQSLRP